MVQSIDVTLDDVPLQETIYYIAGWFICAIEKEFSQRNLELSSYLEHIADNTCVNSSEAKGSGVPIGKVHRLIAYGCLEYHNRDFSGLYARLKNVSARFC